MDKLISIILPTYNGSKFINQTIDSCLNQTYQQFELIIVNDCSTDDTESIVQEYDDPRVRYFKNEQNLKLPKTLNAGFANAKGEYLTWISDDNYFADDALKKMVAELEEKNSDLVCAPYYTINDENEITGSREVGPVENILLDNIVKACFLYKKEVHEKLEGYSGDLFLVEDYDFWIRTVYHGFKLSFLQEKIYYYRFHEGSLTESRRKDIAKALYGLLEYHIPRFEKSDFKDLVNASVYLRMAKIASGVDGVDGKKYLRKALMQNKMMLFNADFLKTFVKRILK